MPFREGVLLCVELIEDIAVKGQACKGVWELKMGRKQYGDEMSKLIKKHLSEN